MMMLLMKVIVISLLNLLNLWDYTKQMMKLKNGSESTGDDTAKEEKLCISLSTIMDQGARMARGFVQG